jgi:hypothetical protein
MVYMEPTALGLEPLLTSWLATLPPGVSAHAALLGDLFRWVEAELQRPVTAHTTRVRR